LKEQAIMTTPFNPLAGLAALALALSAVGAQAQVAVIVNSKSATASMTADQVAGIFLGKTAALPSGATAVAADQSETSALREQFYGKVTGKQAAQVKAAWSRLVFSGKGTPPKELASSAEVKKFVAANPDAIGYIEKSAVDGTVKVVLTVD
jgi:ABC-type phosphate transport system substrate-binding protein